MRERILKNWAHFAAAHPWLVITAILFITVLAAIPASQIKMEMHWADLLPAGDPMVKEFNRVLKEYKSTSTIIVVVQGKEAQIKKFAERIAPEIEKLTDYVERVDYKIDKQFFAEHGFMLSKAKDLEQNLTLFKDLNLLPLLKEINNNFEKTYIEEEEPLSTREKEDKAVRYLDGLEYLLHTLNGFLILKEVDSARVDAAADRFLLGDPYIISQDKTTLLINIKPTFSSMNVDEDIKATMAIQKIIDKAGKDFSDVRAGITGMIPLQKDEMEYTTRDMRIASIIALVLVLVLFILTFRMWSSPVLAALNLIVSVVIAAGLVGLFLGRLNLMTSMFAVILIGLGIDYSIHIISLYSERRVIDKEPGLAMEQALIRAGPGIVTGALTTACAFFALTISVTRGIKEMGIVLGIGIICAMLVTIILLPALLIARERVMTRVSRRPSKTHHIEFTALENIGRLIVSRPMLFLLIGCAITGYMLYQAFRVRFDYNMLNIEPEGLPTVALQDTIIKAFDLSPDFAMVAASSIDEARAVVKRAKAMPSVGAVNSISEYLPTLQEQKRRRLYIERIHQQAANAGYKANSKNNLNKIIEELERLDMNIYELGQLAFTGGQDRVDRKCQSIIGRPDKEDADNLILTIVEKIKKEPDQALGRLNVFQKNFLEGLKKRILKMANSQYITLDNLPDQIKNHFINKSGDQYLVIIYPRGYVWNYQYLTTFTRQLGRISSKSTGLPPMFLKLINYIGRDGLRATIFTIFIVFLLLWMDFRSLWLALLGIIPLIAGGIWMVGLLQSFGAMFNVVNVMGIPMIVGIGIDDGVHLIHRYIFEGFNKTPVVLRSTGKAILLTSLTTIAGFGSLMVSKYQGFVSLGLLLTLGVAACFLTTIIFLPSIISLKYKSGKNT